MLHNAAWIMDRQLDRTAGKMLQSALEAKGMKFRMQAQTARLVKGIGRVCAVRFRTATQRSARRSGASPPASAPTWRSPKAGIHCNRGIVVTDTLQTYDPAVYLRWAMRPPTGHRVRAGGAALRKARCRQPPGDAASAPATSAR